MEYIFSSFILFYLEREDISISVFKSNDQFDKFKESIYVNYRLIGNPDTIINLHFRHLPNLNCSRIPKRRVQYSNTRNT